jgi:hypothetical protein
MNYNRLIEKVDITNRKVYLENSVTICYNHNAGVFMSVNELLTSIDKVNDQIKQLTEAKEEMISLIEDHLSRID